MFFLCVRSLFVSFMFQKIFLGYTCILGLPWPGIRLLLLGPPHCFFWMLWDFSPRILIWKTGWWKFTLPARDKQPEGLGVILCCGHFFSTLCTAVPDISYRSWSLPCSPALCAWETSRPIMGEPGLGKRCLSLDLMAPEGSWAAPWEVGSPWWALYWSCGSSTHSLASKGCEMGPVGTSALLAAPCCFPRKESCESAFNLVPLALYPAEIPQSWWHIDGTLSYFPMLKQISPIFILPWSFLSLSEGGSLGGSWTSVLSFTIFPKSFIVNTVTHTLYFGIQIHDSSWAFPFLWPPFKIPYIYWPSSYLVLYFSWTLFLSLSNFSLASSWSDG